MREIRFARALMRQIRSDVEKNGYEIILDDAKKGDYPFVKYYFIRHNIEIFRNFMDFQYFIIKFMAMAKKESEQSGQNFLPLVKSMIRVIAREWDKVVPLRGEDHELLNCLLNS